MILNTGQPYPGDIISGASNIICPNGSYCTRMIASPNGGITNFDNFIYSFL